MTRVVVTGIGTVSALGNDRHAFTEKLKLGKTGIRPFVSTEADAGPWVAAAVSDFDAGLPEKQLAMMDRVSQFAVAAGREAVAQSGLDFRTDLGLRSGVIVGTGAGGMTTLDAGFHRLYAEGSKRLPPLTVPRLMVSACASQVGMDHGIRGPSFVTTSACASANHAIGTAFHMIRSGMIDAAVTGGSEACLTYGTLKAWEAIRVMAPDLCRPFSRDRKGLVLGEGAGMFVLERRDHALARGAQILGEILGFGMSADAGDIVTPSAEGAGRAIAAALADAGLGGAQIDYVSAHGTGTLANDITETRALHDVFGAHAGKLAISSTKSLHGHALGASGALELAATLLGMQGGFIPPTANFAEADPQCDLDYVPNETRFRSYATAISNSFAFGGLNAVLALGARD